MNLYLAKTDARAHLPTRATDGSAGLDFRAIEPVTLYVGQRVLVDTGWSLAIPRGYAGYLHSRSGHGHNHGVALSNGVGVIDADFRGSLQASLINHGQLPYHVAAGDRIAQLVVQLIAMPDVVEVDELPETMRGHGGFGSTGTA